MTPTPNTITRPEGSTAARPRAEVLGTFRDDLERPAWLFWHLHRERLACITAGDTDSLWYMLVCRAIVALQLRDYAELTRAIERMEGSL